MTKDKTDFYYVKDYFTGEVIAFYDQYDAVVESGDRLIMHKNSDAVVIIKGRDYIVCTSWNTIKTKN